ncbi:MAG: type II toxin-antitoxin system HicA family toxin [Candidatus Dadabacteria bacterium]|nr:type II toxin-antitoxin system HicA family toxin [Candidatus Dadabacteria bacterium]MDE0477916.1 type II toxin-antitoxin system HicA family toxin [Candidatus Dadabacteria bacterium]
MSRLVPLPFKKVREVLLNSGFVLKSSKGSHFKYENKRTGKTVIVPRHGNKDIPVGTLHAIISRSGLPRELFVVS